MAELKFGVFVPQGWKMELSSVPDPQVKWAKAVEVAELAEELGFDSLWVYDHYHNVPVPAHETMFDWRTTLAAISQRTSRIKLGQMVGSTPYRNPGLLAKVTSNIDVVSGGRLIWGIGTGWYPHEFKGYGYEFPKASDRIRVLRETVEIVKAMWSERDVMCKGRHCTPKGAQCDPKPVQQPHPQILIGGGGEQLTLRVVARHQFRRHPRTSRRTHQGLRRHGLHGFLPVVQRLPRHRDGAPLRESRRAVALSHTVSRPPSPRRRPPRQ